MWIENKIVKQDLEYINSCDFIPWEKLRNKTVFITGTTGLIGQNLVNGLLYVNIKRNLNIKIIGLVRDLNKANDKFKSQLSDTKALEFVVGDVRNFKYSKGKIDYIVHGASITSSKDYVERAKEVKSISIEGTKYLLDLAKEKNSSSFVYLSSMEVYGYPKKGHICKENESWNFDLNNPRNSYPLAKLECEKMCKEYYKKYGISTKVARLAQTFGPGTDLSDERVYAQFARCVKENKNIVLNTKGETERTYIYVIDTITAILTLLLNGDGGEIYNVASEKMYCSIYEVAKFIAEKIAENRIKVVVKEKTNTIYLETSYLQLCSEKLKKLNWKDKYNFYSLEYMK